MKWEKHNNELWLVFNGVKIAEISRIGGDPDHLVAGYGFNQDYDTFGNIEEAKTYIASRFGITSNVVDGYWKCYHCNQVFTDSNEADEHFGKRGQSSPQCKHLCSGYGVFPNGRKCEGCSDCENNQI